MSAVVNEKNETGQKRNIRAKKPSEKGTEIIIWWLFLLKKHLMKCRFDE
jgi:hypothetical protein